MLPTFLVVGAQRCGTTLLHTILRQHPDVYVPSRRKEVHYFDRFYERGSEWYAGFFEEERPAVGEVTPDYLFEPQVPARIKALLPPCRIVVLLRDPVERAWSGYRHRLRTTDERRSFEALLAGDDEIVRRGFYAEQLERYTAIFDDVLVMSLGDLQRDPGPELDRLAAFLRLSAGWPDADTLVRQRVNEAATPHWRAGFVRARQVARWLERYDLDAPVRMAKRLGVPALFGERRSDGMPQEIERELTELYRADVAQLERMLGRGFGWRSSR
jgi:hypothetical protein